MNETMNQADPEASQSLQGGDHFQSADRRAIRAALLEWYERHRRDLPWRGVESPYAVWVSEVMLQQTQVATVVDYYRRWMGRFPHIEDLAEADLEEVMELWAGLGYYRRARFLYESACRVVDEMQGRLPNTVEGLKKLKGIGPYTAGAIASIAFDQPAAVVDGNVERVLSRLRAVEGDPKSSANQKRYWSMAAQLVDRDAPGDFNQAVMELGATVCTPQRPACEVCPLRRHCRGFDSGEPGNYPGVARRSRQKPVSVATAVVVRRSGDKPQFLLLKRPPDGLLGGLWEFPSFELEDDSPAGVELDHHLAEIGLGEGTNAERSLLGEVVHHFSHIRMTIRAECREIAHVPPSTSVEDRRGRPAQWVERARLEQVAMSAAMRKVLMLYDDASRSRADRRAEPEKSG